MGKETGKKYRAEAALTLHETPKSKLVDDSVKREQVSEVMSQQSVDRTDSTMDAALATMNNGNGVSGFLLCSVWSDRYVEWVVSVTIVEIVQVY